jgi:hypothetical protein
MSFVKEKISKIFDASIFKVEMRKPSVSRPHVQEFAINGKDKSYCLRLWFDLEEGTLDVVSLEKCNIASGQQIGIINSRNTFN